MHLCVCVLPRGALCREVGCGQEHPSPRRGRGTAPWGGGRQGSGRPSTPCSVAPVQLPLPCSSARGSRLLESRTRGVGTGHRAPRAQEWGAHGLPWPACKGCIRVCGSSVPVFMLASAPQVRCPCCARPCLHACLCACTRARAFDSVCDPGWVCWGGCAKEA